MAEVVITRLNHKIFDEMRSLIEKEDITENPPKWAPSGIETDSHITVFYGIPENISINDEKYKEKIKKFFSEMPLAAFKSEEISFFDLPEHDVLIVIGKQDGNQTLKTLHSLFKKTFEYESTHEYIPHVTLGFVKKGKGDIYIKQFNERFPKIKNLSFSIKDVVVSDEEGNEETFKLNGEM